jgi:hypothetical protein
MEIVLPPSDTRLVGPYGRVGRCGEEKISAPVGNRTLAVQPVGNECTDWKERYFITAAFLFVVSS